MATSLIITTLNYWLASHPQIKNFHWDEDTTWGASPSFLISTILTYLTTVSSLYIFMRNRKPVKIPKLITSLHDLILITISITMALGCTLSAYQQMPNKSWIFCFPKNKQSSDGPVFFWTYVFYLSKIFEFSDTIIILLKKKPLTFLHIYHHATVVFTCYMWVRTTQSLVVIGLVTNSAVHVVMYTYYLLCSLGKRPKWKKMVTNIQIIQFMFGFAVAGFTLLYHHFGSINGAEGCCGMWSWWFTAFFNTSLLVLFSNFHAKSYGTSNKLMKNNNMINTSTTTTTTITTST